MSLVMPQSVREVPTDLGEGVAAPSSSVDIYDPSGTLIQHHPRVSPDEIAACLKVYGPGWQLHVTTNPVTR